MTNKPKILLVTPPLLQPNTPYPATAYLKGYLNRKGYEAEQYDLSIELLSAVFTPEFLTGIFNEYTSSDDPNIERIYRLRAGYIGTIGSVMRFLRGEDPTVANLICSADYLPQAGRFANIEDLDASYGNMGVADCAKYLATLYLEDISDFIREVTAPHFGLIRYGEQIALSVASFSTLQKELEKPKNRIEEKMLELFGNKVLEFQPDAVGFSVPFPGNLLSSLRCAEYLKTEHPGIRIIMGGGYPATELRSLTDPSIFNFTDYIILDDGELPVERILGGGELVRTFIRENGQVVYSGGDDENITHLQRGCPDFSGLPLAKYISLTEMTNPMHRLWSDGRWNKIMAAHGCYWAKCAFCDTSLDYICRYDAVSAAVLVDWMEQVMAQTGQSGFHFVDEAVPPKLLKEMALEILRRGLKISWWGNIRFESHYTGDLCQLLAASGCVAVSGGVEVASDRLLEMMNKGVSIEQLTITLRNFYYAGIMVHTYLMYGFPTQTLQETIDSLEVVRQMFQAELISSAFWHRYAMTAHSPSGKNPEEYGVKSKANPVNPFANNEIRFTENRNYNIEKTGEGLRKATYNYMRQTAIEKPVHKWFEGKIPVTEIEESLITDHLLKPDASRIYDDQARLVWIGNVPQRCTEGLVLYGNSKEKVIKCSEQEAGFLLHIIGKVSDLGQKTLFSEVKEIYKAYSEEPFVFLYHSKKWDIMRGYGLLQI